MPARYALNNAAAATLKLEPTGSITQAVGPLTVANLTGSAGIFASLTQPTNQIDTLGAFSTKAGFALVNNKPLLVAGPVAGSGHRGRKHARADHQDRRHHAGRRCTPRTS